MRELHVDSVEVGPCVFGLAGVRTFVRSVGRVTLLHKMIL